MKLSLNTEARYFSYSTHDPVTEKIQILVKELCPVNGILVYPSDRKSTLEMALKRL